MSRKGGKTPTIRTKNMWFTILSKGQHDFTVLLQLNNTERTNKREKKRKKESCLILKFYQNLSANFTW